MLVSEAAVPPQALWTDRLSPADDREPLEKLLDRFLADSMRRYAANPHIEKLYNQSIQFVLQGGKRIRPRLCLASYRIISETEQEPPPPVWRAAASLEIFHAFMLVHDDLIDGSVLRRDRATLHEAIRSELADPDHPTSKKKSTDLALVAGDLLCTLAMRMLSRSGLEPKIQVRAHKMMSDILLETGVGQALDIVYETCPLELLTEDQIVEAYQRKTARYTISGPLALGALMAGARPDVTKALRTFGDLLGYGYQVRNDLESLATDLSSGDHADLDTGKRTLVLWLAYQLGSDRCRRELLDGLEMPVGLERRRRLLQVIERTEAIRECRLRLDQVHSMALTSLDETPLDANQRHGYLSLMPLFSGNPSTAVTKAVSASVGFPIDSVSSSSPSPVS